MKQKKSAKKPAVEPKKNELTAGEAAIAPAQEAPSLEERLSRRDIVEIVLFSLLLLAAVTVMTNQFSILLMVVALIAVVANKAWRRLAGRLCLPVVGLLLFAVMQGAAAIYSPMDDLAVGEYVKFLAGFSLVVIALARFEKRHIRGLLWGVLSVCAFIALISIDISGTRLIFTPVNAVTSALGMDYSVVLDASAGSRNNGLYNDANITGAIMGMASFVGWYLLHTARRRWERLTASVLLGIVVMSLLLCVSRGAWLCFVLALLICLAVSRGQRLRLFLLMLFTGMAALLTGVPAMAVLSGSNLALLCAILCGVLLFVLDTFLGDRVAEYLLAHQKATLISAASAAVLVAVVVVVAFTATRPYVFEEGSTFNRYVTLPAGEYTLSSDLEGDSQMYVVLRTKAEALQSTGTSLYNGSVQDVQFSLQEKTTIQVHFYDAAPGTVLHSVSLSDGTSIPMEYRFLPDMISDRLQGSFLMDNSFLLRVQYDVDALKLFAQKPLAGHGLASTEGFYTTVQPFFYQSKYVHNHVLQVMSDMGLLGLAGFAALLAGSLWILIRRLRQQQDLLAGLLAGAWAMMNLHSLMEINFSNRAFLCIALPLLVLPVLCFTEPVAQQGKTRKVRDTLKKCGMAMAIAFGLYLAVFGALLQSHINVQHKAAQFSSGDMAEYLDTVNSFIKRDVFHREELMLSYVSQAIRQDDSSYYSDMVKYVRTLRNYRCFTSCTGLAMYYYLPLLDFEEGFACSREGIAQKASDSLAWNDQFRFYREQTIGVVKEENVSEYLAGVLATAAYMEEFNQGRMEAIQLNEENVAFIETVTQLKEMPSAEAMAVLNSLYGKKA